MHKCKVTLNESSAEF